MLAPKEPLGFVFTHFRKVVCVELKISILLVRHLLLVQVAIWIVLNLFSAMLSTAAQSYVRKAAPNEKHQRHRVTA